MDSKPPFVTVNRACWAAREGEAEPQRLSVGDVVDTGPLSRATVGQLVMAGDVESSEGPASKADGDKGPGARKPKRQTGGLTTENAGGLVDG